MPISAKICTLPLVRNNRPTKVMNSKANATSRMNRNVGCSEEPGVRIFVRKEGWLSSLAAVDSSCVLIIGPSRDSQFARFRYENFLFRKYFHTRAVSIASLLLNYQKHQNLFILLTVWSFQLQVGLSLLESKRLAGDSVIMTFVTEHVSGLRVGNYQRFAH
jgi:hypothetical protein